MIFREVELDGVYVIELHRHVDERGFFARTWDQDEFDQHGLASCMVQASLAWNTSRGTLRGMHYQVAPWEEAKLVRCARGKIHDVVLDIRPGSRTFRRWAAVELSAENYLTLYVPPGFAHGYLTLADDTEVVYHMSRRYAPEASRGIRYDDPAFGIVWPEPPCVISTKDQSWPNFLEEQ